MSGIRKLDHPFYRPAGESQPPAPGREQLGRAGDFDTHLKEESAVARAERRQQQQPHPSASDERWTRARAVEELKTLVKAVEAGITDPKELTDLIFYARHPEMIDVPLTKDRQALLDEWNQISALLVHPMLNEVSDMIGADLAAGGASGAEPTAAEFSRAFKTHADGTGGAGGHTARFDDLIVRAVECCPGLSPAVLKSLLAQESNFNPQVINQYGYAGIAQFGREAAREVGLRVGVAGSASDERLDPSKAIPAAARLLNLKAQRLGETAFQRYGQPTGAEFWKFVLAAYNGGEGTVTVAMGHAYRDGLERARAQGLIGPDAVGFARRYASKWENLRQGGLDSPLAQAAARFFPSLAAAKYYEISNYPVQIMSRVSGHGG